MKRVLIVEDYQVLARTLRFKLKTAGFHVEIASNGHEALQFLELRDFDLVVTDYQMPKMDGREFCQILKNSDRWSNIPIVLLSAKALELDYGDLAQLGILEVFDKPVSPNELTSFIQRTLGLHVPQPMVTESHRAASPIAKQHSGLLQSSREVVKHPV